MRDDEDTDDKTKSLRLVSEGDDDLSNSYDPVEDAVEKKKTVDSRRARDAVSKMLMAGVSDETIYEVMAEATLTNGQRGFKYSRAQTKELVYAVFAQWAQEDEERRPYFRAMAQRRIHDHITKAATDGKWTAVANMEKVLGMVQGTLEEVGTIGGGTSGDRWTDAALKKLTKLAPEEYRELIENQRRILATQAAENEPIKVDGKTALLPPEEPKNSQ